MINFVKWLASRIIKVLGNSSKAICYLFYCVFPKKHFLIPHCSKPIFNTGSAHNIPKIIWQTNYTDRVTIAVYLNYLFNRLMSPTYEYRFMDTSERADFIKKYCPAKVFESYSKLQIGAAQADLWRVLVLRQFGGVYLDIDAHVVWPLGFIIKPEYKELYLRHKDNSLTNYFIASTKNNPHLDLVIGSILDNIDKSSSNDVAELTGPRVLDRALNALNLPAAYYNYTCYQGSFTNEFFQYVDLPQGKWTSAQEAIDIIKR
jgi:mannosyltransferase OCH1-like enzyme